MKNVSSKSTLKCYSESELNYIVKDVGNYDRENIDIGADNCNYNKIPTSRPIQTIKMKILKVKDAKLSSFGKIKRRFEVVNEAIE